MELVITERGKTELIQNSV